jgi:hypothetical protein
MRLSGATESAVNHSKQMKRGVYEQGWKISKPAQTPCHIGIDRQDSI